MYNRYRILKDGTYEFHTFKTNRFNHDEWLENNGRFELNQEGSYYTYYNQDGTPNLVKEQADIDAKAYSDWKKSRADAVDTIEVTYGGVVYQGDEKSQDRMSRAINGLPDDVATINWIAKDNTLVALNRIQLRELLGLCGAEQSRLWNLGRP